MRIFQNEANNWQKGWCCRVIYNKSRLKLSFSKFYGRYNVLFCDYKLSLAHMLNDMFHILSYTVVSELALRTGNSVYLISTKDVRRVWPVSSGCLLLLGTWSYLCICRGSVLHCTWFCICLLDYDYVWHIVNFAILHLISPVGNTYQRMG
jgi:hypothetical protein